VHDQYGVPPLIRGLSKKKGLTELQTMSASLFTMMRLAPGVVMNFIGRGRSSLAEMVRQYRIRHLIAWRCKGRTAATMTPESSYSTG